MKKSLVLAMAMALGVTASAYAANPFSDVPAGHWAYDSIQKLAAAGVVDGYGDTTFGGDKLMTRYEMAQIIAKAMAKGVNVDKLAAEFADELDTLGVRVANLEKKADNVKITGQIRISYKEGKGDNNNADGNQGRFRTRLYVDGKINDTWSYTGRLENNQFFAGEYGPYSGAHGDDSIDFNWAYVTGRIGGVKVEAGRQGFSAFDVVDNRGDGLKLSYGKDLQVFGWVYKASNDTGVNIGNARLSEDRVYIIGLNAKLGVAKAEAKYYKADTARERAITELMVMAPVAEGLYLKGAYYHGDSVTGFEGDNNGYLGGILYKGAKANKPGTWGLYAQYSNRPYATYINPSAFADYASFPDNQAFINDHFGDTCDGYKGFEAGGDVTLAKNIVATLRYTDFDAREGNGSAQSIWSEVVFSF